MPINCVHQENTIEKLLAYFSSHLNLERNK